MLPPIVSRFVSGTDADGAITYARSINEDRLTPILNYLGEHYTDPADVEDCVTEYTKLIDKLAVRTVNAAISLKPTQLGLLIDEELFHKNAQYLVSHAVDSGVFVWFDMEDHTTTDATLDVYYDVEKQYSESVGICVQANLKRTGRDLSKLVETDGKIRLVKGAYAESEDIAHTEKRVIDEAYRIHLKYLFEHHEGSIAVASHDDEMISLAAVLHEQYETDYEIQMLMGVREADQRELAENHTVYQYAPYGSSWFSYFYRRLQERKNIGFIIRALLQG